MQFGPDTVITKEPAFPLQFALKLERLGFELNDDEIALMYGIVRKFHPGYPMKFAAALREQFDCDDTQIDDVWQCAGSARPISTVEFPFGGYFQDREEEFLKILTSKQFCDTLYFILRGMQTYAAWHSHEISDCEVAEAVWSADNRLILTFRLD